MKPMALLVTRAALAAHPPPGESHSLDLPGGTTSLLLVRFESVTDLKAYVGLPGVQLLPPVYKTVPVAAVAILGPAFGVVATDTIGDALEKIAASWPHAWLYEH